MLAAAERRLGTLSNLRFVQATFQTILRGHADLGVYDFIISSLAIHHLTQIERVALFHCIKDHLEPAGWFLNIDTVFPDESALIDWQYELWREWIIENEKFRPAEGPSLRHAPDQARHNPDNKLARLQPQLNALRSAGFELVDCLYRNGLFVIYCGRKGLADSPEDEHPAGRALPSDHPGVKRLENSD
jgi:tRNA (cmo5U34)-methyltransferase